MMVTDGSRPPCPITARKRKRDRSNTLTHNDYTVGWVCALPKEQTAATAMLDERHDLLPKPPTDTNTYTLGSIGNHCIVIACLPKGRTGTNSAATVVTQMIRTFPNIKFGLMVGIGGGIPPKVKLGDVVVSSPTAQYPGVVQWDSGKAEQGGRFKRTGSMNNPPNTLLTAVARIETEHEMQGSQIRQTLIKMGEKWPRLAPKYTSLEFLIDPELPQGQERPADATIHYGLIASGNQVIKEAQFRDELNRSLGGSVLCVEMEAAGLMNYFPCLIIRGISDYADSRKNDDWQEYAAAVAAAYAKELLGYVQQSDVDADRPVKDILTHVLSTVSDMGESLTRIKTRVDEDMHKRVCNWFTEIDFCPQQTDYIRSCQPGTGQWLLDSEQYRNWMDTNGDILFCPGIPGAGKTMITAILIQKLLEKFSYDSKVGIAYTYCNFRRQGEQTVDGFFLSLLKQLLQQKAEMPEKAKALFESHQGRQTRPSFNEIMDLCFLVAGSYARIFLVIDALDEWQSSDGSRSRLLSEVLKLQAKCRLNLFATSRFISDITSMFRGKTTLEIRASDEDVRRYLDGNMVKLPAFVKQSPDLQQTVKTSITKAVDGMFLLAQLYLSSLGDKMTPKAMRSALSSFEKQQDGLNEDQKTVLLSQAYEQAMQRIYRQELGRRELARKALLWITCARRQLTTTELIHALAIEPGTRHLDEDNFTDPDDVVSACAGLVTVDKESGIVRLVHYTTQEYFELKKHSWFPGANDEITECCVTYLMFDVFKSGPIRTYKDLEERRKSNPFYDYAARNWGIHARVSSLQKGELIFSLIECKFRRSASIQTALVSGLDLLSIHPIQSSWSGIHIAAYWGLSDLLASLLALRSCLSDGGGYDWTSLSWVTTQGHRDVVKSLLSSGELDVDLKDGSGRTPLSWAASQGHEEVVKIILESGKVAVDSKDEIGQTPLLWAASEGHVGVVKILLQTGEVAVGVEDQFGRTPLFQAISRGHEEVVKVLLETGELDVNSKDAFGWTPLLGAASWGHEGVIRVLLETGKVDVNLADDSGQTPLSWAAEQGHENVVRILMETGQVSVDSTNRFGRTPLSRAADYGQEAVVKILLETGEVEPDSKDGSGRTPLSWAAAQGHEGVIRMLLLTREVSVDSKDRVGRTPLSWAAEKGHEGVVKALLETGEASVNSEDESGRTPVLRAVEQGHERVVKILLQTGEVDVNSKDAFGWTPLSWAALGGHERVAEIILEREEVDVDSKDDSGRTPLSLAASEGHEGAVMVLLETEKADVDSKDDSGQTPLSLAVSQGYGEIVKLLQPHSKHQSNSYI